MHREGESSLDISADLAELARTPVAVVCSGAKSILDLPRTVERLETLGVPIYGYPCDEFPAFWRRSSGLGLDQRFDDLATLAAAIRTHHGLGTGTGIVVANPVPEADELDGGAHERALNGALAATASQGVRGRDVTPWLLDYIRRATGGRVVQANIPLLEDNARVAGELAVALAFFYLVAERQIVSGLTAGAVKGLFHAENISQPDPSRLLSGSLHLPGE